LNETLGGDQQTFAKHLKEKGNYTLFAPLLLKPNSQAIRAIIPLRRFANL
jgi:hypothetical protein